MQSVWPRITLLDETRDTTLSVRGRRHEKDGKMNLAAKERHKKRRDDSDPGKTAKAKQAPFLTTRVRG